VWRMIDEEAAWMMADEEADWRMAGLEMCSMAHE
jgi:hypothetical protein